MRERLLSKMDQSQEEVSHLLDTLIDYRKTAPQIISTIYAKSNKEIVQSLKNVNIKLHTDEINYNLPDNPFENVSLKRLHQLDEELREKIYKQMQLLSILIKKKDSSVSKVIDEI